MSRSPVCPVVVQTEVAATAAMVVLAVMAAMVVLAVMAAMVVVEVEGAPIPVAGAVLVLVSVLVCKSWTCCNHFARSLPSSPANMPPNQVRLSTWSLGYEQYQWRAPAQHRLGARCQGCAKSQVFK